MNDFVIDETFEIEQTAMRLLSAHDHSISQLRHKLLKRNYAADEIEQVLEELQQRNLLNDQRYAEYYVSFRSARGYGPVRIQQELREKGISEQLAESALQSLEDEWHTILNDALHKKFGQRPALNFAERAQRARFLEYRGFASWMIRQHLFEN